MPGVAFAAVRRAACVLLAAAAFVGPAGAKRAPAITFTLSRTGQLQLTAPGYRLVVDRASGRVVDLIARPWGTHLLLGEDGCLWSAVTSADAAVDACPADPPAYAWNAAAKSLTLAYSGSSVTITAAKTSFDLALTLQAPPDSVLQTVDFPADLLGPVATAKAGYVPTYLPGLKLTPAFFYGGGGPVWTYPSRWAFADYLAYDAGRSNLALYTVDPPPAPIRPVDLGLVRAVPPDGCSGPVFCLRHRFETWIAAGTTWTSPVVRVQVGMSAEQSMLAYRHDNGIDTYPSLADKVGSRLPALAQAPLIKADLRNGVPFGGWDAALANVASPLLLHPVSFQPGAFDTTDPDFLPPGSDYGTTADLRSAVDRAHARGDLVMPYLNASWWAVNAPTVSLLTDAPSVAVQNRLGEPRQETYGARLGWVVSPFAPAVRERFAELLDEWRSEVPVDCLFLDQIGARPWLRDFNADAPDPLSYDDGWLSLLTPAADRCVMVEDGWDRLASVSAGFLGGLLLMQREFDEPNVVYGAGAWQPYPLALWLLHDKVLLYQHDLYTPTMTADPDTLTWNLAFGFMLSYDWNAPQDSLSSPWLDVVTSFQRALGPHYAGTALTAFETPAPSVTRTRFGDYSVLANWSSSPYATDEGNVAPGGFLAETDDGSVEAGAFDGSFAGAPLSRGTHYLVVERAVSSVTVHQPLGDETDLAIDLPATWRPGAPLAAVATTPGAAAVPVAGHVEGRRFVFHCLGPAAGAPAPTYVLAVGPQ